VTEFIVSSQAEADLIEAFDFYEEKVPGLGSECVRSVDAEFARIQRSPLAFRLRFGAHRMAMTERFPYAIYFIHDESAKFVSVRRILHFAQDSAPKLK
jgi:plasmid stabilization system protein ParE